jgi:hypothetical protein
MKTETPGRKAGRQNGDEAMSRITHALYSRTRTSRAERECWLALLACNKAARHGRMSYSQVRYARRDLAAARNEPEGSWSR